MLTKRCPLLTHAYAARPESFNDFIAVFGSLRASFRNAYETRPLAYASLFAKADSLRVVPSLSSQAGGKTQHCLQNAALAYASMYVSACGLGMMPPLHVKADEQPSELN